MVTCTCSNWSQHAVYASPFNANISPACSHNCLPCHLHMPGTLCWWWPCAYLKTAYCLCTLLPPPACLPPFPQPLPDISDWLYGGATQIGNAPVHIWQRFDRQGGKTSTYTFYTTPQGTPVR